jgi:hypothetical protein
MDPEQFAKWASAAQSVVTAAGIIAGGLWVLFTFWNLRLVHRSRAEIAEIEAARCRAACSIDRDSARHPGCGQL